MKKLYFFIGFIALFGIFTSAEAQDLVPGQIIIDIKHEYLPLTPTPNGQGIISTGLPSIDSLNVLYQVFAFEKITDDSWGATKGFYLIKFPDSLDVNLVHSSYSADIHVHLAGLTGFRYPHVTPDDYYFPQQWGLRKMKCPEAWRHTNGSRSIIIQIMDGGTDYGHPDLVHNIWQNLGEDWDGDDHTIEWDPNQNRWILDPGDFYWYPWDDDGNGYCDDLVGFNFTKLPCDYYTYDSSLVGYDPAPCQGWGCWGDHGDKTAGTAAAVTDNRITPAEATWICWNDTNSVAGTSWFSKIMIARIGTPDFIDAEAIKAIQYARNKGAKIISMSWGGYIYNAALRAVLDSAWNEGILLIASAGNEYTESPSYPAAYPNVIAVAATDSFDVKKDYSNWGTWVDLCAPTDNWSPDRDIRWSFYCYSGLGGTSCSAPFVAGVAALVWSCDTSATNAEVRSALENTADNIDAYNPGYEGLLGHGRVNAWEAVKVFRFTAPPPGDCNADLVVDLGDLVYLINYLYQGGPPPDPMCVGDVTDDGAIGIGDVIYLITYIYKGGPPPRDGCD